MLARGRKSLDVDRALELRAEGLSWREVGEALARDEGRKIPYQPAGVANRCSQRRQDYLQERAFGRE